MRLFTSPYVLLALASSSALAVPLIMSERDGGSGNIPSRTLSSSSAVVAREPFGFGPGPALNSFTDVQSPTDNMNLPNNGPSSTINMVPVNHIQTSNNNINLPNNAASPNCASNTPHVQAKYLESVERRSDGPSDISERAAKKVTKNDLFRHYFRKAVAHLNKGKKRPTSPSNSKVN